MANLKFVLVNESTLGDLAHGGPLTLSVLQSIATACQWQANTSVFPEWGQGATVRASATNDGSDVAADEIACWIKDSLPDVPGAVGYHDKLPNGAPVAYFAREDCTSLTTGSESLSVCVSHEICETLGDPGANRWADEASGTSEKALELCDQVQNVVYLAPNGVSVSDFLLQAAFDPGHPGPWDFMKTLTSGDDYSKGYIIMRIVDQQAQSKTPGAKKVTILGTMTPTQRRKFHRSRIRRRGASV